MQKPLRHKAYAILENGEKQKIDAASIVICLNDEQAVELDLIKMDQDDQNIAISTPPNHLKSNLKHDLWSRLVLKPSASNLVEISLQKPENKTK